MALSDYQWQATLMFPKITKRFGGLRGDGAFGILNKCGKYWSIWLYPTAEKAKATLADWAATGCCRDCMQVHEKILIKPDADWQNRKVQEQLTKAGRTI
jgi:hypothetical protein